MPDISKLVVRMEAENTKLTKALEKSQRDVRKFERSASGSLRRFKATAVKAFAGIGAGVAVAGMLRAAKSAINAGDEIQKMSQSIGISTEALSQLEFAAELSGSSLDGIGRGAKTLATNMLEASRGTKTYTDLFKDLDVEFQNGDRSLRNVEDVIEDVADQFVDMEDSTAKTALAVKLFGRAGLELIPLLNEGSAGIRSMREEADRLGVTMTQDMVNAMAEANDNMTRLEFASKGLSIAFANALGPTLSDAAFAFARITTEVGETIDSFHDLENRTSISGLREDLTEATEKAVELGLAAQAATDPTKAIELSKAYQEQRAEVDALIARLKELESTQGGPARITGAALPSAEPVAGPDLSKARVQLQEMTGPMSDYNDLLEEAARLTDSLRTPNEKLFDSLEHYDELLDKSVISQETWSRAVEQAWKDSADVSEDSINEMSVTADEAWRRIQNAASDQLFNVLQGDFDNMGEQWKRTLDSMVADAFTSGLFDLAKGAFSETVVGGFAGALFGAGKATGGPVSPGITYPVNEVEPEFFRPNVGGEVIPLSKMPAANDRAGITVHVSMVVNAKDAGSFRQSEHQIAADLGMKIQMAMGRF